MSKNVQVPRKPDKNTIIAILRDEMPYLREQYNVSEIGLFGSYVRGEADDESDIDVIVSFSHPPGMITFMKLEDYLTDRLGGIKVDLVLKNALKPNIGRQILSEAVYA